MDRKDLERAPRSELLKTIDKQQEQILRRETRLRDVVTAYKGVLKEKEALESSIKALSAAKARARTLDVPHSKGPPSDTASDRGRESDQESEAGSISGREFVDPLNATNLPEINEDTNEASEDTDEVKQLQEQVETLSASLLTLTEEKSKLEASYVSDKKALKQENEQLTNKIEALEEKLELQGKEIKSQNLELKNKIRAQQLEREKEQTDHVVMLRELQKLVAKEREAKETVENQLDETQFTLKEKERLIPDLCARYDKQIKELNNEIQGLKAELIITEEKSKQPSPMLLDLQKEAAELKAQHRLQLQQDLHRVQDAEEKAKLYNQQSETRISELETKLSELSETVGNYERLRFQDQQTIQKYKERANQLDMENMALARAASSNNDGLEDLESLDVNTIVDRIIKLKGQLKLVNERSERPVNIEELLMQADGEEESPLCRKYREELEQLRDEFERYRLRAQSVLKNKKENPSSTELEVLKEHLNDLREKLRTQASQTVEEVEHLKQREENLRKTLMAVQEKHKQEMTQLEGEHHTQLQEYEDEIKKQRDRTISMLAEKDREIQTLRATSTQRLETDYLAQYRNPDMAGASCERQTSEDEAVERLLRTPPAGQGEMTLLFFAQEQARKDVDITTLRKQKRELEVALRELQMSSSMKQEQLHDEIDRLKEEIRKLERSITREGANLEYLKNVTYKFLISNDAHGKQQMLNAITTILQFSPQEKSSVQAHTKGWWV